MQRRGSNRFIYKLHMLIKLTTLACISSFIWLNPSYGKRGVEKYVLGLNAQWYEYDKATSIESTKILHSLPMDGSMTCLEDTPDMPTCTFTNTCWTPKLPLRFFGGNIATEGHNMDRLLRFVLPQVTPDMTALEDLKSNHSLKVIKLVGTTIVSTSYQYHIPHYVESLLPLINTVRQSDKFMIRPPYRVIMDQRHPWFGDKGYQLNLTDIVLSAMEESHMVSPHGRTLDSSPYSERRFAVRIKMVFGRSCSARLDS